MKAIVVGGGIGGLSAAIALRQAGLDVSVYEQAPEAREVGAGISIWGNAIKALRKIGAADRVVAAGETMRRGELRDRRGRVLSRSDVGEADSRLGAPSLLLHRADLLAALHAHLPQGVVRFGRAFTGMDIDAKQVSARFDDATGGTDEAIADVLIGADGLNSAVRAAVHGPEEPRYSGYTCWRGVVAFPYERWPPGYLCEVWGRGKRFGLTRIGAGRIYWFATLNAPPGGLDADARATVRGLFAGWFDPIPAVIEATDPAAVLRNDICDRPPFPRAKPWGAGRVTLLGDAAHPTTPNLGQGACMAIEDAVVLARRLGGPAQGAGGQDVSATLRAYEHQRRARTAMVTNFSWRMGKFAQASSPAACWARDALIALTPRGAIMRSHRRMVGFEV